MNWTTFFALLPLAVGIFFTVWIIQRLINDAGLVDVFWSSTVALFTLIYALAGDGDGLRRLVLALMVGFWGFRLGGYILFTRILKGEEDGRYEEMREEHGTGFQSFLLYFYQLQAFAAWGLSVVMFLIAQDARPFGSVFTDWLAVALFIGGLGLEFIADAQMSTARGDNTRDRSQTIRSGLWAWSRHPNYFGEWCTWLSYAVLISGAAWWLLGWIPAILMFGVMVFGTGIPPNEKRNLNGRQESYQRYQREVSAFLPFPPRLTPAFLKRPIIKND